MFLMEWNMKKIESELKRLGWSKSRLAKEMGLARQSIHQYFSSKPSLKIAENIAKTLNIDERDLLI